MSIGDYKNPGLYYRDKKRKQKIKILHTIKDPQKGKCFFARVRNPIKIKEYGNKFYCGKEILFGLVIENKVFYVSKEDGEMHYIYTNKSGFKLLDTYDGIPEWAQQPLIDKYKLFYMLQAGSLQE